MNEKLANELFEELTGCHMTPVTFINSKVVFTINKDNFKQALSDYHTAMCVDVKDIKRYKKTTLHNEFYDNYIDSISENQNGEWVKYPDVENLLKPAFWHKYPDEKVSKPGIYLYNRENHYETATVSSPKIFNQFMRDFDITYYAEIPPVEEI